MSNKVTIYNVALSADVSLATVSRVLNNPEKSQKGNKRQGLEGY